MRVERERKSERVERERKKEWKVYCWGVKQSALVGKVNEENF